MNNSHPTPHQPDDQSPDRPPSTPEEISRKAFLTRLSLSLAALSAAVAAIPVISALVAPLLGRRQHVWRTVGQLTDFPIGSTKLVSFLNADPEPYAGTTAKSAAWLRRTGNKTFTAFAVNCTHLGCPVRWEENAQLFMCPCHGGVYYKDGSVAAGPPPLHLPEYQVRLNKNEIQLLTAPLPITPV